MQKIKCILRKIALNLKRTYIKELNIILFEQLEKLMRIKEKILAGWASREYVGEYSQLCGPFLSKTHDRLTIEIEYQQRQIQNHFFYTWVHRHLCTVIITPSLRFCPNITLLLFFKLSIFKKIKSNIKNPLTLLIFSVGFQFWNKIKK